MSKIIIGIHGLSNKPEKATLKKWWRQAINDGLKREGGQPIDESQFDLAYWADLCYAEPDPAPQPYMDLDWDDPGDGPGAARVIARNVFTGILGRLLGRVDRIVDDGKVDALKNEIRKKKVQDLGDYYDDNATVQFERKHGQTTRSAIRDTLRENLEAHRRNDILLIAHSMGSIVAYDVLRDIEATGPTVRHLVTIGSPLALEDVKGRILEERGEKEPRVPASIVESWRNYADARDLVSFDLTVEREYDNAKNIHFDDIRVKNGYRFKNDEGELEHNYHKSYGYLRTPELARQLKTFLES